MAHKFVSTGNPWQLEQISDLMKPKSKPKPSLEKDSAFSNNMTLPILEKVDFSKEKRRYFLNW